MYKLWQFFVQHNRFSYLLMVALASFGFMSLVLIPKESAPEVQVPVGVVTTVLPGAPAADVESLVTNELERGLIGALNEVKSITSSSREGVSSVVVEFEASADIDDSIDELKDKIDTLQTELPSDAEDSVVSEVDFVDQPIMSVVVAGQLTARDLVTLADDLESELEALTGVSRVEISGVRDREVTVVVDQSLLARYELSLQQVISGIQSANNTFPVGQIENDGVKYNVAFEGDLTHTYEVANIALATRGGQPVYVRDIATIDDGLGDITTLSRLSIAGAPSKDAASFDVYKQRGGDITQITRSVNEHLTTLQTEGALLHGLEVVVPFDAGADIETDLIRLSTSGMTTVVLVMIVLVFAIGWREGLVAGSAIPLSFVIGFIGLYVSGNTINFVSLFALILAIGILVDSAIVMVEGVNRRMKADKRVDKRQAALDTIKEFSTPLLAGTLTTVSMFSGLFIVGGVTGQFISAIPFTINFILFASLLVALGFVPLIASTFLKRSDCTMLEEKQMAFSQKLEGWYRKKLEGFIGNHKKERSFQWILRIALVLALMLPITGIVRVVFFEQSDVFFIYTEVEMPQGTVREVTDIAARRVEEVLYQNEDIESFVTTVGATSAYGGNQGSRDDKYASFFVSLNDDRTKTSTEIAEDLQAAFAPFRDIKVTVDQPSDGPPTGAALGFRFLGDDLVELGTIADQATELLKEIPHVINVTTSTNSNSTEFVLTLNKEKTAALGLNPLTVSQTLRTAVYGTDATSLTTLDDDIDVVVKLDLANQEQVNAQKTNVTTTEMLEHIQLATPTGETVFLSSLVDTTLRESSSVIRHNDGERVISIAASITAEGNVQEINAAFLAKLEESKLVPDYVTLEIGGETEESDQAFQEMFLALILGVVAMLAVLVLQFNSFRHTRYVLIILPYSLIGIFVGLALTQLPLSFPSIMGFIALSGIVVNNSILLIDRMNDNRRKFPEKTIEENVIDATVSRLRPILLTTVTTVVGMIPLTYASDLWSPLAYAIMFGLTFSVVITLILIPVIYSKNPGGLHEVD